MIIRGNNGAMVNVAPIMVNVAPIWFPEFELSGGKATT